MLGFSEVNLLKEVCLYPLATLVTCKQSCTRRCNLTRTHYAHCISLPPFQIRYVLCEVENIELGEYILIRNCFRNVIFEALSLGLSNSQDSPTQKIPPSMRRFYTPRAAVQSARGLQRRLS